MPHAQQVLTWDLDTGWMFQRIQGQCWLCAEHDHSPVQHLITKAAQWESRMDLKVLSWCKGLHKKAKIQGLLDWNVSKLCDAEVHAQAQPQSAARHALGWTHLSDTMVGLCVHVVLLNSCSLTALSCSNTKWGWWKGKGNLWTWNVLIPRFASTKAVKTQAQENCRDPKRKQVHRK